MKDERIIRALDSMLPREDRQEAILARAKAAAAAPEAARPRAKTNLVRLWPVGALTCVAVGVAVFIVPRLAPAPAPGDVPGVSAEYPPAGAPTAPDSAPRPWTAVLTGEDDNHPIWEETPEGLPIHISEALVKAMDGALPGEALKVAVYLPGAQDYLRDYLWERDYFEIDWFAMYEYWASGVWKDGAGPPAEGEAALWEADPEGYIEALPGRLDEYERQAKDDADKAFRADVIARMREAVGAFMVTDDGYYAPYTFVAVLWPEEIKLLAEEGCFLRLWSPPNFDDLPAFNDEYTED
ncbi:MAG: hypothetical protein LBI44_07270 [Oscillospiraceae bacterium]|jgi:hypothetical protein|nr:hypothetical protein [Oscillospiraceae bacterium]